MDPDLSLVIGILLAGLSVPGFMSAMVERRLPKLPVLLVVIGGYMIYSGVTNMPGGFTWPDVPNAFIDVIARIIT